MRFDSVEQMVAGRTANVSREGLFIVMDPPKPIGTMVRAKIQIASTSEKYTLEGVVVRCSPDPDDARPLPDGQQPGVGVFLVATSAGWTRFCDQLARQREAAPSRQG